MLARFFVDRPIFAWVISIVIVLGGVAAGFTLPIAQYPDITPPTVVVTCAYPGASAQVVADTVAAPIEQQVNGVERMLYMSSQSGNDGTYTLTVTFEIGTDPNTAQVLVQNRVALANPQLPQEVQRQGLTVKKRSPDILLVVSLFSPADTPPESRRDQLYLSNYATIQLRDELARLPGVGDVTIIGQQDYSMRAWLDPDKLQANGLTASDVVKAVQEQNVQVAAGQIGQEPAPVGQAYQYTLTTLGRLTEPEQFGNIVLKTGSATDPSADPNLAKAATGGAAATDGGGTAAAGARAVGPTAAVRVRPVVRLKDVVRDDRPMEVVGDDGKPTNKLYPGIELTAKTQDIRGTVDLGRGPQPSAGLAIFQLPGSNALDTADAVRAKMEELKQKFPAGVDYATRYDTTPFIRQSVAEVFNTLRDAVLLVALVVLLFLQDWRAMILPMIDVPVSLTGTFMVMYLAGFSLNNLTLFGLVLAIGIVVDDAIVVLENIERWVAKGLDARSATINAMGEITGPIVAITLVLSAVFVPAAFISGITGQFYRQFALTIATAMAISAINALTLAPARAVAIFKGREHAPGGEGHEKKDGETKKHGHGEALPWWGVSALLGYGCYALFDHFLGERLGLAARPTWERVAIGLGLALPGLLAGWFVTKPLNRALAWFFGKFNRAFEWATNLYGKGVALLLRAALFVLLVYAGLVALTYLGVTRTPVGFIPLQDKGYLIVSVQLPDAASVQRTSEVMRQVQEIAQGIPGVAGSVAYSGQSVLLGTNAPNFGTMFITFDDFEKRKHDRRLHAFSILGQFNQKARAEVMDAQVLALPAPAVNGLGSAGGYRFVVQDRGDLGPAELQAATFALDQKIAEAGGGQAFTLYKAAVPQLYVDVDRVKCKQLGVALADVFQTLQVYLGGLYTNDFNKFGRTWQVNVQADAAFRVSTASVGNLRVRNDKGEMVTLGALAEIRDAFGPISVQRYNLYTSASVNGALPPGVSTGKGIKLVEQAAKEALTGRTQIEWTELTFLQIREGNSAIYAFAGGVLLVYFILAALYESWTLPLAVLLVVPMCLLSSIAGVQLAHQDINIFTQVGFLVLIGLAAKNAILIVEFARDRRAAGATVTEATLDAAKTRLRPIVMTSLAFILGVVPLVLASGAGAEMRFTLGVAVFAGMIGVTVFGVLLTPVFYHTIERWTAGEAPVAEKKPEDEPKRGERGA